MLKRIDKVLSIVKRKVVMFRHHIGFFLVDRETVSKVGHLPRLTSAEKRLIKETWKGLPISNLDYTWSRIWKREHGFSPYMVGTMWTWSILEKTNPYDQLVSLQNKALCDLYLQEIPFPQVYVRGIDGGYYSQTMEQLSLEEVLNLLVQKEGFIIKPSIDTLCGHGVLKIVKSGKGEREYLQTIKQAILQSGDNFIAQEILTQHKDIARLNSTSINSCRVTTIYLGGKTAYSVSLKVGKKGSYKDNWNSSYFVGIDKQGRGMQYGYDFFLKRVEQTDNGIPFNEIQLPMFREMVSAAMSWHKKFMPQCGIVGWDVFVDEENHIKVIETNLTCPGIVAEQLSSGLFLQPFVKEICEKLQNK